MIRVGCLLSSADATRKRIDAVAVLDARATPAAQNNSNSSPRAADGSASALTSRSTAPAASCAQ